MKRKAERGTKLLNIFKSIFFITFVINIFLFAYKHESKVEHSNYKVLVQESEGSSNYVEYEGSSFPKSGYVLSSYECSNNAVVTQNASKRLTFTGNADSCTLKFDISSVGPSYNTLQILQGLNSNITVSDTIPDYSKPSTGDEGVFYTEDNYGTSYYWRGAASTNYVKFGTNITDQDIYWRIVRINGDGSLRLIYAGTTATETSSPISQPSYYNTIREIAGVGYMYGDVNGNSYSEVHSNTNNSDLKNKLDSLYNNTFKNKATEKYISDTYFCNDRGVDRLVQGGNGYSNTDDSYFQAYSRVTNSNPNLICDNRNDTFTVSDTTIGNGDLTYPIGAITVDELMLSGLTDDSSTTSSSYLSGYNSFWTMTPASYQTSNIPVLSGMIPYIYKQIDGHIKSEPITSVMTWAYVVPVINITQEAASLFEGNGTSTNPFNIPTDSEKTLRKLQSLNSSIIINSGTPNFANTATTDEGLYSTKDDYGTTYYWRGSSTTNYIRFGNWYWRILRINGDGSLRLLYDGTSIGANGNIGTSAYNSSYDRNTYVGYMYGSTLTNATYEQTHANTTSSTIKQVVDSWYESNIKNKSFESSVSDTEFCNDRSLYSGTGVGTTATVYASYNRNSTNKSPILTCPQKNDRFTVNDTTIGNGALTYPIGLITTDEGAMRGAVWGSGSDVDMWTMTPAQLYTSLVYIGYITNTRLGGNLAYNTGAKVKPVINIKKEAVQTITGAGTSSNPFVVH